MKGLNTQMQIQFHKSETRYSVNELSQLLTYCLSSAFESLPFAAELEAEDLEASLALSFVGPEEMRAINLEERRVDKVTDVLSFPMLEMERGCLLRPLGIFDIDQNDDSVFLGELLICLERAEEQALEYGHSFQREVCFLALHGLLHLLGYDHELGEAEAEEMERLQEDLLTALGIQRKKTGAEIWAWVQENQLRIAEMQADWAKVWTQEAEEAFALSEEEAADMQKSEEESEAFVEDAEDAQTRLEALLAASGLSSGGSQEAVKVGFVSIVGRPNAGKSTLLNALSGQHLAIVSRKAQTTRHNIRAIYNDANCQLIFTDTPGLHRPDSKLGQYMQEVAWKAIHNADALLLMVDACRARPTEVEENCIERAKRQNLPLLIVLNKVDKLEKERLLPLIAQYKELAPFAEVLPLSARRGEGLDRLVQLLAAQLPYGPRLYPEDSFTDQSERQLAAEMLREQLLLFTHEEVPHGTAVQIDSFEELEREVDGELQRTLVKIHAAILCDKDSHKGIIIGKQGASLKRIASAARKRMEEMLGCKVFLDVHVKVRSDWRNRKGILSDLGYKD